MRYGSKYFLNKLQKTLLRILYTALWSRGFPVLSQDRLVSEVTRLPKFCFHPDHFCGSPFIRCVRSIFSPKLNRRTAKVTWYSTLVQRPIMHFTSLYTFMVLGHLRNLSFSTVLPHSSYHLFCSQNFLHFSSKSFHIRNHFSLSINYPNISSERTYTLTICLLKNPV
jgi:hypothetical protein